MYGWCQFQRAFKQQQWHSIFRLTINAPEIQKDFQIPGDRTLATFMSQDAFVYSTYNYGDLDKFDQEQGNINKPLPYKSNKGEWTFIYMGYNWRQRLSFAYALYYDREDSMQIKEVKHYIPNQFWFYLGNDKVYPQFEGLMAHWYLNVGKGAFTMKPKELVQFWPYEPPSDEDKVLSALLGNQGLSSVKLTRSRPVSGKMERDPNPLSGKLEAGDKP